MSVFLVVSDDPNARLEKNIQKLFPDDYYTLSHSAWLIDAETTTDDLAKKLDFYDGHVGRALVFRVDAQAGWHKKSLWEWLELE